MSLFGKTFKLFLLPGLPTTSAPSSEQILTAISNREYIKDISICYPITGSTPSLSSRSYANNVGVIYPETGSALDNVVSNWQQQGYISYTTLDYGNSERYVNAMNLFPITVTLQADSSYLVWDESTRYALILYPNNLRSEMVDTTNGSLKGTDLVISGAVVRSFNATWDRVYFYITFKYGNNYYNTYVTNSNTSNADFTMSSISIVNITSFGSEFMKGATTDYVPILPDPDDDPYNNPADPPEGGWSDGSSDNIGTPSLPTISAADTGFITLYNPSASDLRGLASYLWSDLFSLDTFKKLFSDPMSAILGLSILPVAVPSGGSRAVRVGNITTNVSLPVASQQFIEVNCGSVTLQRQSPGTYLDFSPYTKVDLYLPFIGTHPLNVDEVMGKSISVKYHVDILSGACTAFVSAGGSVLYQFIGACAISVPITGNDWTQAINGVLNIAGSIGSMILTGGATAPMAAGSIASTAVNSLKPNVEKSGAAGGSGGLMGVKRPYLIISRPRREVAKNQNKFIGYPTYKNMKMDDLDGYNQIEETHLDGIPATAPELEEIKTLLKGGVIF